ncbi:MAG: glycosyltransferase family 2 protein [Victivallaceae bacterium]|nr:glycosyltransferase family 2 protein [Victivallaceae bacterium]
MGNPAQLAIIVPCYNEEEALPESASVLSEFLRGLIVEKLVSPSSYLCFVNDGSADCTWDIIRETAEKDPLVKGLSLSRNFGHQGALLAGLFSNSADIYVSIDADLQDDHTTIRSMVEQYYSGCEVVVGVRSSRNTDTFFKRFTANFFYHLMTFLGVKIVENAADFRLMSRRAVETLHSFNERNLFLRGVVPLLGFRTGKVFYERKPRTAGVTKYPLRKMLAFAWDGITSFSVVPLRLAALLGAVVFLFSLVLLGIFLWAYFVGDTIRGWTSMIAFVGLLGGAQLFVMAILGEYVGKIYIETKARPHFIVSERIGD